MKNIIWNNNSVHLTRKDIIGLKKSEGTFKGSAIIDTPIYEDEIPNGLSVETPRMLHSLQLQDEGIRTQCERNGVIRGRFSLEEADDIVDSGDLFINNDTILSVSDLANFHNLQLLNLSGCKNLSGDIELAQGLTALDVRGTNVRDLIVDKTNLTSLHEAKPVNINIVNSSLQFSTFSVIRKYDVRKKYSNGSDKLFLGIPYKEVICDVSTGITSYNYSIDDVRDIETINLENVQGTDILSFFSAIREIDEIERHEEVLVGPPTSRGFLINDMYDSNTDSYIEEVNTSNIIDCEYTEVADAEIANAIAQLRLYSDFTDPGINTIHDLLQYINPELSTAYKSNTKHSLIDINKEDAAFGILNADDIKTEDHNIIALFFCVLGMPARICIKEAKCLVNKQFITIQTNNGILPEVNAEQFEGKSTIWYDNGEKIVPLKKTKDESPIFFKIKGQIAIYELFTYAHKDNIRNVNVLLNRVEQFGFLCNLIGGLNDQEIYQLIKMANVQLNAPRVAIDAVNEEAYWWIRLPYNHNQDVTLQSILQFSDYEYLPGGFSPSRNYVTQVGTTKYTTGTLVKFFIPKTIPRYIFMDGADNFTVVINGEVIYRNISYNSLRNKNYKFNAEEIIKPNQLNYMVIIWSGTGNHGCDYGFVD